MFCCKRVSRVLEMTTPRLPLVERALHSGRQALCGGNLTGKDFGQRSNPDSTGYATSVNLPPSHNVTSRHPMPRVPGKHWGGSRLPHTTGSNGQTVAAAILPVVSGVSSALQPLTRRGIGQTKQTKGFSRPLGEQLEQTRRRGNDADEPGESFGLGTQGVLAGGWPSIWASVV